MDTSAKLFRALIDDLKDQADLIQNDVTSFQKDLGDKFHKERHWSKIGLSCSVLSKACTELALAFSKPPEPTETEKQAMIKEVAKAVDVLLAWCKTYPSTEGKILVKVLYKLLSSILTAVTDFLTEASSCTNVENRKTLVTYNAVWQFCSEFKKIPSDNKAAAVQEVNGQYKMVSDALTEVETSVKEFDSSQTTEDETEEEDEERWCAEDRPFLKPSMGLMMAGRGCLKKLTMALKDKDCSTEADIKQQDLVVSAADLISPSVDDFVLPLYPPLDVTTLLAKAESLADNIHKLVAAISASYLLDDETRPWVELVGKGASHNVNKLKSLHIT